jgi:hypothetical protein
MKFKKTIIPFLVIAVAIVIAMNRFNRRQTVPAQNSSVSEEIAEHAKSAEKPVHLVKKNAPSAQTQPMPVDVPAFEATSEAATLRYRLYPIQKQPSRLSWVIMRLL